MRQTPRHRLLQTRTPIGAKISGLTFEEEKNICPISKHLFRDAYYA